ncbi:hypothetical protein BD289DRAFT_478490 [Coniella lustricola]|uniref:Short chain dehydrogenase n=1 Tax=Coniella lustricola TaxID=2025994 RepID=A0A2T3AMV2_9PEZI|nr:hypothetical protein BD289DRAFT_478490 [Coniella lustricola]
MSSKTIVLVTGANQGLGFEIARKLGKEHSDYHIIMAGRRKQAIHDAAAKLEADGVSVEPLLLDMTSDESIEAAAKTVSEKHGHLDVLINNAGIADAAPAQSAQDTSGDSAQDKPKNTTRSEWLDIYNTNVAGTAVVTDAFIPLLEKSTQTRRIVFMSSSLGSLTHRAATDGHLRKQPWWPYTVSKTAMTMVGVLYASRFDGREKEWKVNVCCPGYCATNLNGYAGASPAEQGAINACRLATLGPDGETNTFTNVNGTVPW